MHPLSMDQAGGTSSPAIFLEGLTKSFRRSVAVNNATFTVNPGDVFGLLGPNGAGKTTIIRMMVGLMKPNAGVVRVFGFDPQTERRKVLQRTSTILEAPAMYPKLSGYNNLRAMALMVGIEDNKRIYEVLETIHLLDRAKDRFETYSLGMKQRLCIASSLLTNPQLIILDEPTNGLDPAGMHDIRELIRTLASQGRTVLLSSHLLNEVQQVCNRVAILQHGVVQVQGLVADLLGTRVATKVKVQAEQIASAMTILQSNGWSNQVSVDNSYLVVNSVKSPNGSGQNAGPLVSEGSRINQILATNGIYASEILPDQMSLEEYYLNLTDAPASASTTVDKPKMEAFRDE